MRVEGVAQGLLDFLDICLVKLLDEDEVFPRIAQVERYCIEAHPGVADVHPLHEIQEAHAERVIGHAQAVIDLLLVANADLG